VEDHHGFQSSARALNRFQQAIGVLAAKDFQLELRMSPFQSGDIRLGLIK